MMDDRSALCWKGQHYLDRTRAQNPPQIFINNHAQVEVCSKYRCQTKCEQKSIIDHRFVVILSVRPWGTLGEKEHTHKESNNMAANVTPHGNALLAIRLGDSDMFLFANRLFLSSNWRSHGNEKMRCLRIRDDIRGVVVEKMYLPKMDTHIK